MSRADQRKFHYIYKITRTDTGRFYIGMHSTDDLEDEYFGSGKIITASIKKHGKDRHVKEILEFLPSREALKLREKELVNEELIGDKLCMNLKLGGEGGGGFTKEAQQKGVEAARGLGGQSTKRKRLESQEFAKTINEKISKSLTNYLKSNPEAAKVSQQRITKAATSKSAVDKRKKTLAEINHQQGSKNSQYGKCWITKDGQHKSVQKTDLQLYLNLGYSLGRK